MATNLLKIGQNYENHSHEISEKVSSLLCKDQAIAKYKPIEKSLNEAVMNW